MWKLDKPCLLQATTIDIDKLTTHCSALGDRDKATLKKLYLAYDDQKGMVTKDQLNTIADNKTNAIHGQYNKTYSGKQLYYIRTELFENIDLCPCCSINSVSQLDHFMPQSEYKALSVCRLNLVPTCGECNNKKNDNEYSNFIHAYYDTFPNAPFLIAKVGIINSLFTVKFNFDSAIINNKTLEDKLIYQANNIQLWDRLRKATNSFISTLCNSSFASDSQAVKLWLKDILKYHEKSFGLNDWRTAVIRGILECPDLDINVINNYKINKYKINRGAGA